jgi:DNA modification methylase
MPLRRRDLEIAALHSVNGRAPSVSAPYWRTLDFDGARLRGTCGLYLGDTLAVLRGLPSASVHCAVTSPPYWGLRDYETAHWEGGNNPDCDHHARGPRHHNLDVLGLEYRGGGQKASDETTAPVLYRGVCGRCGARRVDPQLGTEPTVQEYVEKLVAVFRELRRVLRDDGTFWLNIGDSYTSGGRSTFRSEASTNKGHEDAQNGLSRPDAGLPPGNLVGAPWRLAFALQDDGWVLRMDNIWRKPGPMPESVTNRCTKAHEYVFHFSKGPRYYYDAEAVKEELTTPDRVFRGERTEGGKHNLTKRNAAYSKGATGFGRSPTGRNKRSVWTISHGGGYKGGHFSTFPKALVEVCVKAGTSEKGCCSKCGAPWARVLGQTRVAIRPGDGSKVWANSKPPGRKEEVHPGRSLGGQSRSARERVAAEVTGNRDPVHHVTTTRTLGWRPGCACYNLPLVGNQPREPKRSPKESDQTWTLRYGKYQAALASWEKMWDEVRDEYAALLDGVDEGSLVPCVVLDPFVGSGTAALVALRLGRHAVGVDVSEAYLRDHAAARVRGFLLSRPAYRGLVPME